MSNGLAQAQPPIRRRPGRAGIVKMNKVELSTYMGDLTSSDSTLARRAVSGLSKYTAAEWDSDPDGVTTVVTALVKPSNRKTGWAADGPSRVEAARTLGNIGTRSPAVVPELLRLLQEDPDTAVRTEAARALGKIGEGASAAGKALAALVKGATGGDALRGEAARALARVAPQAAGTAAALEVAASDRSGHVGVCAAEALWRVSAEPADAVPALASRLGDPTARDAAAQALYRIGPKAKAAVPALLTAAKTKDRLFREAVLMALRKIDPEAAAKIGA